MKKQKTEIIKVCRNCYGYEPCLCNNKKYIEMDRKTYDALKRTKGG